MNIKKAKEQYGNQFVFLLSAFVNRAALTHLSNNPYNKNYDCLTYLVVDTNWKVLKGMRIGANINNEGTEYHGFVLDYDNQGLLTDF